MSRGLSKHSWARGKNPEQESLSCHSCQFWMLARGMHEWRYLVWTSVNPKNGKRETNGSSDRLEDFLSTRQLSKVIQLPPNSVVVGRQEASQGYAVGGWSEQNTKRGWLFAMWGEFAIQQEDYLRLFWTGVRKSCLLEDKHTVRQVRGLIFIRYSRQQGMSDRGEGKKGSCE